MRSVVRKGLIGAAAVALLGAGLAGYLLGQRSAVTAVAETRASDPASIPRSDAETERLRAWQIAAAALATPAQTDEAAGGEQRAAQDSNLAAAAPNVAAPAMPEPKPMTAVEERERAVARLRNSGPDQKNLAERAQAVGNVWTELAKKRGSPAQTGPWECHKAGCAATIVHESEAEIEDLTSQMSLQDEFRSWEGPKMRSGPIKRPDGKTEVTWILYAGDEGTKEAEAGR